MPVKQSAANRDEAVKSLEFLYLDQKAVLAADVLDMRRAVDVVGRAQALFAIGQVREPHKIVLRPRDTAESEEDGRFNILASSIGIPVSCVGMKCIASFPANRKQGLPRASGLIHLNSPRTGLPIAVMEGSLISAMRTGAMTALGARCLAPAKTSKVGVVGCGVQSHTQILGLFTALPDIEEIALYGRHPSMAQAVAEDCKHRWGAPVHTVPTIEAAYADADVALTITTAHEPLMLARHIKPGALTIQLAGHECEFDVIRQCQKIVTDSWDIIKLRGIMTPAMMYQQGLLNDSDIYAGVGELIQGSKTGRENDERIHYCHMGMGLDDVSLACSVYETACQRNLGVRLPLWEKPFWV